MSIELKGVDNLLRRLDKLSRIESKKIVEEVGTMVEKSIKAEAQSFSKSSAQYIGKCESRTYGNSYYLDIGLSNDKADFELWNSLWYQHWGYFNHGWRFTGQIYIDNHQLWFDKAVQSVEEQAKRKIKEKLRAEIRAFKQ